MPASFRRTVLTLALCVPPIAQPATAVAVDAIR
jgi:hypothetical protein